MEDEPWDVLFEDSANFKQHGSSTDHFSSIIDPLFEDELMNSNW
jgi:hypothetical protein